MVSVPPLYVQLLSSRPATSESLPITLYSLDEIPDGQLGYRDENEARPVTRGAWDKAWLVIGHEELAGEPIFIDTEAPALPVFSAPHGQGYWTPILIASSAAAFFRCLDFISTLQAGQVSRSFAERSLLELNQGKDVDVGFWLSLAD
jgi:hypothetical protein